MPYYCTVPRCTSMAGKAKNVSFHQFPRDEELAKLWNKILKRGKPYTKYSKVCSLHFTPEDYTITSVGKNKGQWRTLRKDAIPSQNLPSESPTPYQRKQWGGWTNNAPANVLDPALQQQMAQAIYMQTMLAMQAAGATDVSNLNQNGLSHLQATVAPLAHTSTANDTDILKGKQTNTNEQNTSYKCNECSKCFKDPDVYILHKRTHIKNEKENFNLNLTLQANPILANLLKTNTDNANIFDNNMMSVERLLMTALAANMEGYMRSFTNMIKTEGRGDLNHDKGDPNHDRGDSSHGIGELGNDRGDLNHDMGGLSHGRGDLSHDRGNLNHESSNLTNGDYVQDRLNFRAPFVQDREYGALNQHTSLNDDRNGSNYDRNDSNYDRSDSNYDRSDINDDDSLNNDTGSLVHDRAALNHGIVSNIDNSNDRNRIRDRIIELYRNNDAYDSSRNVRYYENNDHNNREYHHSDSVTNYSDNRGILSDNRDNGGVMSIEKGIMSGERGMSDDRGIIIDDNGLLSDDRNAMSADDDLMSDDRGIMSHERDMVSDNEGMSVEKGLSEERGIISDGGIMSDEEGIMSDEGGIISDEEGINSNSQGTEEPNCDSDFTESIDSNKLIIDENF